MSDPNGSSAFFEGRLAAFRQENLEANPYRRNSKSWRDWRRGWYMQQVRIPLPSGVTLLPNASTEIFLRHELGKQAAALKARLESYVRESWEHVEKVGLKWRKTGSIADREFNRYRELFLRVGKVETLLGSNPPARVLHEAGRMLDEIELDLEEACH